MTGCGAFGADRAFPIRDRFLLGVAARQSGGPKRPSVPVASAGGVPRRRLAPPPVPSCRWFRAFRSRGRLGPQRNINLPLEPVNSTTPRALQYVETVDAGSGRSVVREKE